MSPTRPLGRLERKLARSLLLVSLALGLTWIALFFASGSWVSTDGEVMFALSMLVGGMVWLGFAVIAALMLLLGVEKR